MAQQCFKNVLFNKSIMPTTPPPCGRQMHVWLNIQRGKIFTIFRKVTFFLQNKFKKYLIYLILKGAILYIGYFGKSISQQTEDKRNQMKIALKCININLLKSERVSLPYTGTYYLFINNTYQIQ